MDQRAKDSYSLGYEFGENLRNLQLNVDSELLLSGVREGPGKTPAIGREQLQESLEQLRRKMTLLSQRRLQEHAVKNLEAGKSFLEENKTKEGVKTLASGLQYKVLRDGDGPSPKATDMVTVNYRGTLVDGTEFDSSYSRGQPAQVSTQGVIRGWTEALQLMKPGSRWEIFVPSDLAYGTRQFGRIPPNSTLIFEIELLSVN